MELSSGLSLTWHCKNPTRKRNRLGVAIQIFSRAPISCLKRSNGDRNDNEALVVCLVVVSNFSDPPIGRGEQIAMTDRTAGHCTSYNSLMRETQMVFINTDAIFFYRIPGEAALALPRPVMHFAVLG